MLELCKGLNILQQQKIISQIDYNFASFVYNIQKNDNVTLAACLLSYDERQGNICLDLSAIAGSKNFVDDDFAGVQMPVFDEWIKDLNSHPWVAEKQYPAPLVLDNNLLYLGKRWFEETGLAENIKSRLKSNIDNVSCADEDIKTSLKYNFSVINGGPGSGKTTIVLKILTALLQQNDNLKIALAAPTGKAADRLKQSIDNNPEYKNLNENNKNWQDPKTIHRLLKQDKIKGGYRYNQNKQLPYDLIIVDEASMVSLSMMFALFVAIKKTSKIILIGDYNQLEAVEAGDVFASVCGTGYTNSPEIAKHITQLTESYRFKIDGGIYNVLQSINNNNPKKALDDFILNPKYKDITLIEPDADENEDTMNRALDCFLENYKHSPKNITEALGNLKKISCLATTNKTVDDFNQLAQQKIQKLSNITTNIYNGKPLMITQNDYNLNVFNGDCGVLWQNDNGSYKLHLSDEQEIDFNQLKNYKTAYAITTHKSQGSEYDKIIMLLPAKYNKILSLQLIYTAISRAKKNVVIIGTRDIFIKACNNKTTRTGYLNHRLGWK
ncbi:MAG: exodeoxyribonuclease V subunit alpha [Gammaproteobacteria bacterium]|nr:MAG: exodeoxyribonuclease V subunit alpha [Gammaproteobacteria bacterium]